MMNEIYRIEWEYSDVGNINRRKELAVFHERIKNEFNIEWNALDDIASFDDIHVDLALMLAMQQYITENQEFPKVEDNCFISSVLELRDPCVGVEMYPEFEQGLVGKTKIQFPFEKLEIIDNDYEMAFHFESVSNADEFLIEYSVAQNCFGKNGWGSRDNFVAVNSTSNVPLTLNWCGESIESTNLCITVFSTSENSPILKWREPVLKKKTQVNTNLNDLKSVDYYDDDINDINPVACPEVVKPGSCVINGSKATCKGAINGCEEEGVNCPRPKVDPKIAGSAAGGIVLAIGIVITIVVLFMKKRESSASEILPTYAQAKTKTRGAATGYSYR
ncbi:Oidioi.mRNA.OKI2018_I69.chr2.g7670.t1.cds [Oikopleura dioica]|uniref:Oidioi.mRNA.OKI2018_I69.chr2.g7670.t1.cds n=1 Tax=Oikopleura dioica TaxID=34765 RepID=A0ABN7T9A7_OIKDI|nr:Oidioi.mRNA.OKI2018_I69.chr2.g7670.t1.cds [Oikopleura dioica]